MDIELINKETISKIIQITNAQLIEKNKTKNFTEFDDFSKGVVEGMATIWDELEKG